MKLEIVSIVTYICIFRFSKATFLKRLIPQHILAPIDEIKKLDNTFNPQTSKELRDSRHYRAIVFWSRAVEIYMSYKSFQTRASIEALFAQNKTLMDSKWQNIHEVNSDRMLRLCLDLKGFYLKTGQFLATRHDFMPSQYTSKLCQLHDNVPPLPEDEIKRILESGLGSPVEQYFSSINLASPIGSASVAQVHCGIWKATGEKVAVKVQYPDAERLMTRDLRNLRVLAEFLQRAELKFDILSAIKELQRGIKNEFNFDREARNMETMRKGLLKNVPEVTLPRPLWYTKQLIVMTYVEGKNLGKLAAYKSSPADSIATKWVKRQSGKKLFDVLSKAWGEQLFELRMFNADPHPGNICLHSSGVGLLDWGQVKIVSDKLALEFSAMVVALHSRNKEEIVSAFHKLGVRVQNPKDIDTVESIAITMLDSRVVPGYIMDPFNPNCAIKKNAVTFMPSDLYFVVRTVQLLRGIAAAFDLDYCLSDVWEPYARRTLERSHATRA